MEEIEVRTTGLGAFAQNDKKGVVDTPEGQMPISAGRSSSPDSYSSLLGMVSESLIQPDFHIDLLGALENLAKYNPDVSYALDNIVQLGNTKFDIFFNDDLPDGQEEEMMTEIQRISTIWYGNSGGILSLRNDLLAQLALTGAISSERVPTEQLDGIAKVILVNPKNVRFSYNEVDDEYEPYQFKNNMGKSATIGGGALSAMNKLNPITYKYLALRKFNESPYAIPPFLAAIDSAGTEKYMLDNFKTITKKLGILGFLNVLVNKPAKQQGETVDDYTKNVTSYLGKVATEVEKGLSKGYVVGYKDSHTFNMESVNSNVTGAKDLFRMNSELKMAGLKQDPLMLGRNYSTTETVGRVILAKLTAQITNYQYVMDMYLGDTIYLHLLLKGYSNLKYVKIESAKPLIGDETREQEAYAKKIANAKSLYDDGVIDQTKRAQMLGYDTPDQEEPRVKTEAPASEEQPIDSTPVPDPADPKTTQYSLNRKVTLITERRLSYDLPEYPYENLIGAHPESCSCGAHTKVTLEQFAKMSEISEIIQRYAKDMKIKYSEAVKKITYKVALGIQKLGKGTGIDEIVDNVMYNTFLGFESNFKTKIKDSIKNFIEESYVKYRQDASIFDTILKDSPNAVFDLKDFRTMNYYTGSDQLYLGKFITDESTKKKITEFIKKYHIEEGMPIGKDPAGIALFREQFADVLEGEDWKIARIINTTSSSMKNTAALNYMQQAEVAKYRIIGISDKLQCGYCASLNGREFDVATSLKYIETYENTDPMIVGYAKPFITSKAVDLTPESIQTMTSEEIQAKLPALVPAHGSCRCQLVAVL